MNFTKGLPTSLAMGSEQQWDKDNAWPPMIHMVIEGFRTTGDTILMKVAETMATSWLSNTYKSFLRTHAMFEKYNVSLLNEDGAGSGGEYEVQVIFLKYLFSVYLQKGFGWTNGVILDLLDKYGHLVKTGTIKSVWVVVASLFLFLL